MIQIIPNNRLLQALVNFKPTPPTKHWIKVDDLDIVELCFGKKVDGIEIDIPTYQRLEQAGIKNFQYKDNNIVKKEPIPKEQQQTELIKVSHGYLFHDNDPFWVKNIGEEGYVWKIK